MEKSADILISEFLDGGENGGQPERLGKLLATDKKFRKELLDQMLMHQLLEQYFSDRRPVGKLRRRRGPRWLSAMWQSISGIFRFAVPSSN